MKKILVTYPSSLFPTEMMSQKRAVTQILTLAKDHKVEVVTFCRNQNEIDKSIVFFRKHNISFTSIKAINFSGSILTKYYFHLIAGVKFFLLNISQGISKFQLKITNNRFLKVINEKEFDIIITHYWYSSFILKSINRKRILKIIDLHAMVEEDAMLNSKGFYYTKNSIKEKKQVKKKLKLQKKVFGSCDIVIPNSITQIKLLKENYPSLEYFYCPNGQDFSLFNLKKDIIYDRNTVLFYGSMGGEQNIGAFKLFYKNVWPLILKENKLAKLLIVGNKPPNWIKILGKKENITVTGFVEDPISIILRACCMVLPMDIGVGFRGRIVEAMIAGVPIVGNYNALDCIRMENKIHGYITDDYSLMAEYALKMMRDDSLRNEISGNAYQFVQDNYSIEATFKKLSTFLMLKLKQL